MERMYWLQRQQELQLINIGMGAVTVHKAFELGIEFEKYKDAPGFRSSYLQEADVVIIDEMGLHFQESI